jgi:hypothetical protein
VVRAGPMPTGDAPQRCANPIEATTMMTIINT